MVKKIKNKLFYSLFGGSLGLTGIIAASGCSGGNCTSCYTCAIPGAGIILLLIGKKLFKDKKRSK
jgi:hypothetical protein